MRAYMATLHDWTYTHVAPAQTAMATLFTRLPRAIWPAETWRSSTCIEADGAPAAWCFLPHERAVVSCVGQWMVRCGVTQCHDPPERNGEVESWCIRLVWDAHTEPPLPCTLGNSMREHGHMCLPSRRRRLRRLREVPSAKVVNSHVRVAWLSYWRNHQHHQCAAIRIKQAATASVRHAARRYLAASEPAEEHFGWALFGWPAKPEKSYTRSHGSRGPKLRF